MGESWPRPMGQEIMKIKGFRAFPTWILKHASPKWSRIILQSFYSFDTKLQCKWPPDPKSSFFSDFPDASRKSVFSGLLRKYTVKAVSTSPPAIIAFWMSCTPVAIVVEPEKLHLSLLRAKTKIWKGSTKWATTWKVGREVGQKMLSLLLATFSEILVSRPKSWKSQVELFGAVQDDGDYRTLDPPNYSK